MLPFTCGTGSACANGSRFTIHICTAPHICCSSIERYVGLSLVRHAMGVTMLCSLPSRMTQRVIARWICASFRMPTCVHLQSPVHSKHNLNVPTISLRTRPPRALPAIFARTDLNSTLLEAPIDRSCREVLSSVLCSHQRSVLLASREAIATSAHSIHAQQAAHS